jgi:hypothetical protein
LGKPLKPLVGTAQQLGDEFRGDIEGHVGGSDTVLFGGFDKLGRKAGLGQQDPDRSHGGRARAEMEHQFHILAVALLQVEQFGHHGAVDRTEVRGAGQFVHTQFDAPRGLTLQPFHVGRRSGFGVIAQ